MIESLQTVLLALAASINSGHGQVVIETQSISSPAVIMALETARRRSVSVSVVLGAKAEYTLDDKGRPRGGNRPYDSGPQGWELRALDAMNASVFIPPKWSELDRPVFEPGIEMNAHFALVDKRWAALCTAPFSSTENGICWSTTDQAMIDALLGLNSVDSTDDLSSGIEADISKKLTSRDLIVTPGNAADFYMLLRQPWRNVAVSNLTEGKALDALLHAGTVGTFWMAPNGAYSRTAIEKLKRAGWAINPLSKPFTGIVLTSSKMAFIGSQKIDQTQIEKSRGLGLVLAPQHVQQIEQILQIR